MLAAMDTPVALERIAEAGQLDPADPAMPVLAAMLDLLHSPGSVRVYATDLAAWAAFCRERGSALLAADRPLVTAYVARMRSDGLAPDTARRRLSVVRSFYREALEQGRYTGPNPAARIRATDAEPPPGPPALTADEVDTLLGRLEDRFGDPDPAAALRARRDHLAVAYLVWTGLRAAELARVKLADFGEADGYPVLAVTGKGSKAALVKLDPALLAVRDAWVTAAAGAGIALRAGDPLLVPLGRSWPPRLRRTRGRYPALSTRALFDLVDAQLADGLRGGRRTGPHLLRKTGGTLVWQGSHDLLLAQRFLRHRRPATTEQHYIKPLVELADAGIDHIRARPPRPGTPDPA